MLSMAVLEATAGAATLSVQQAAMLSMAVLEATAGAATLSVQQAAMLSMAVLEATAGAYVDFSDRTSASRETDVNGPREDPGVRQTPR
ncbi:MAG: hypothetical protein OXF78_04365 [Rhodospirillales bacterium]|nr:hypothetical protein [Rhodospirillales bacterium]